MDQGYFMGEQWCMPITKREEKYPIYEDAELYAISLIILANQANRIAQDVLSLAIHRREVKYGDKWGFKIANAWYKPLLDLLLKLDNVKFIAGTRDRDVLISRMMRDWEGYSFEKANQRLQNYRYFRQKIVDKNKPLLHVDQQELLNNPEEQYQRIEEFIEI